MGNVYFRQTCAGLRRENEKMNNFEMTDNEILLSLPHKKGNKEIFFWNIMNLKLAKEILFQTYQVKLQDLWIP